MGHAYRSVFPIFVLKRDVADIDNSTYSRTSVARTLLRAWNIVLYMGSSNHHGLIIAPGQNANNNEDNLGIFFLIFYKLMVFVECTHRNCLDNAILMSTHNI